ncbi:MAG: cytochrome c oxidase subunit II [Hyphomicrobiaceae bacterium]
MIKKLLGIVGAARLAMAGLTLAALGSGAAYAGSGQPTDGQLGMQEAVTPVAHAIHSFHDLVNLLIIAIAVFVLILMIIVVLRFNEKANPKPSTTTHNTLLEVAWTVIPIVILVVIAVPSFRLLHLQYAYPKPDLTIKATAYQWYWSHEYPDQGGFSFDSVMLTEDEIKEAKASGISAPRNLAVDNEVIVPVNKNVHVLVTAGDVLHNWTIPAFGSKVDAVPGRLNATWFRAEKTGVFYGQCSELCGKDHAFMPIAVRVVSEQVFKDWAAAMKAKDKKKAKELIRAVALDEAGRKVADANAK